MSVLRRNKRATIQQVAQKAGVCKTTVSHALSGRRPVSPALKQKILRIAEQLGYRPHYAAQVLPKGQTKTIAVLVRDLINQYNSCYLQAIEQAASARGYRVYVCVTGTDQDNIRDYLDSFGHGQADGVLIVTSAVGDEAVVELAERGYPVVTPGRIVPGHEELWNVPVVVPGAFRRLLEYLYDLGHRELGFLWHIRSHVRSRIEVVEEFAAARGLRLDGECEAWDVHTPEQAFVVAHELLDKRRQITALVCANDMLAVGAMAAAHKLRLAVPGDLTVTGFGDVPMGRYCTPPITTVRLPITEIANTAVNKLLDRIEDRPAGNRIDSLPDLDLLIRGSSGPPRQDSIGDRKGDAERVPVP